MCAARVRLVICICGYSLVAVVVAVVVGVPLRLTDDRGVRGRGPRFYLRCGAGKAEMQRKGRVRHHDCTVMSIC